MNKESFGAFIGATIAPTPVPYAPNRVEDVSSPVPEIIHPIPAPVVEVVQEDPVEPETPAEPDVAEPDAE